MPDQDGFTLLFLKAIIVTECVPCTAYQSSILLKKQLTPK